MSQVRFNLVLSSDARLDEVTPKVESAVLAINEKLDLSFRREPDEDTGPGVMTRKWTDRDAGSISLVDDTNVPALYLAPFLRISYGHQTLFNTFESWVPVVPVGVLRDQAERGEPSFATALARLGLGETEEFEERTLRILALALGNQDVEVRRTAALAIFLLRWSGFRAPLEEAIAGERDADLREQLTVARRHLQSALIV
jgi:hypothetical protein